MRPWPISTTTSGAAARRVFVTTTIDPSNIDQVQWHCSFAYDSDRKHFGKKNVPRAYLGDRGDYLHARSFSANWVGEGMCLLVTDQHAEYAKSKAIPEQSDPNVYGLLMVERPIPPDTSSTFDVRQSNANV